MNGSEGRVHRADHYITVTRPTILVVARVVERLGCMVLCARRIRGRPVTGGSNPRSDYEQKWEDFQPYTGDIARIAREFKIRIPQC